MLEAYYAKAVTEGRIIREEFPQDYASSGLGMGFIRWLGLLGLCDGVVVALGDDAVLHRKQSSSST